MSEIFTVYQQNSSEKNRSAVDKRSYVRQPGPMFASEKISRLCNHFLWEQLYRETM